MGLRLKKYIELSMRLHTTGSLGCTIALLGCVERRDDIDCIKRTTMDVYGIWERKSFVLSQEGLCYKSVEEMGRNPWVSLPTQIYVERGC